MTREKIKEAAEVMLAFTEGKAIQYRRRDSNDRWLNWINDCAPSFDWLAREYRIKPEPQYRPFKTQEECWNEMLKHHPFGWVTDKCKYVHIVCVRQSNIEFNPDTDDNILYSCIMTFSDVLEQGYTFTDGTPFGINEE